MAQGVTSAIRGCSTVWGAKDYFLQSHGAAGTGWNLAVDVPELDLVICMQGGLQARLDLAAVPGTDPGRVFGWAK